MIQQQSHALFPLAQIHPEALIHEGVIIEPFSIIEKGVEIGSGTFVGAHSAIREGVKIGRNCRISSGCALNAETQSLEYWVKTDRAKSLPPRLIIGDGVHIEPNAVLHGEITIGDECWIGSGVTVYDGARIGARCKIFPGAVISAIPQDLKFGGEKTLLEVGENTVIRECATLNRGTLYSGATRVGRNCLIMAYVHIAHDCVVGDNVVLANAVNMAGHVEIGDFTILGGMVAVHQFVKIGSHVMVQGGAKIGKDVPPYIKIGREPVRYEGVNSIGLTRRGFSPERINVIHEVYRHLFVNGMNVSQALAHIEMHMSFSPERDFIMNFVRSSERGIIKGIPRGAE